jgi:hypothetical protein
VRIRITFSGLCLFVPDNDTHHVSVLLPDTQWLSEHCAGDYPKLMRHFMRARVSGDALGLPIGGVPVDIPINGLDCNVARSAPRVRDDTTEDCDEPDAIELPATIMSVVDPNAETGQLPRVTEECLAHHFCGKHLGARFTFPWYTKFTAYNCAEMDRGWMAAMVEALIPHASPHSTVHLGHNAELRPLGGMIDVFVGNLPASDWMHPPQHMEDSRDMTPHYDAYRALYPAGTVVHPPQKEHAGNDEKGMDPYTCMTGSGCGTGTC